MATPVPLNFMWTDKSVLLEDIQRGISANIVKWTTEFYKNKSVNRRFELDVYPSYPLTMKGAAKYVLADSDGVVPDLRSGSELAPAERKEYDRLEKIIKAKEKEQEDLEKRRDLVMELVQSIERGRDELYQRLDTVTDPQERAQINAELVRVRQDKANAMATWKNLGEAISRINVPYGAQNKIFDKMAQKMSVANGDNMLRLQMAFRYAIDGIGSETRINVIFCRTKPSSTAVGETRQELYNLIQVLPSQFLLWPYQYIVIDLNGGRRKVLAHEVVHLPWRGHPPAKVIFKGVKKHPIAGIPWPDFEEVDGGELDGPKDDIMNYSDKDPEAKDTTMRARDQERLEWFMKLLRKGEADFATPPTPHHPPP
ncbi:MAG TPA: hypothetical protein VFX78_01560 [Candidatus Eisenbacteria bacterium]|nr:hypothetical protein [Candidatus Eisenbacteria bacterium]